MAYKVVVVPQVMTLRASTVALLSAFQKTGGVVVFADLRDGQTVRVDGVRDPIHDIPPGPESTRAFGFLRQAGHSVLEGVGMKVRHAGNDRTARLLKCGVCVGRARDSGDRAVLIESNGLVGCPSVGQQYLTASQPSLGVWVAHFVTLAADDPLGGP